MVLRGTFTKGYYGSERRHGGLFRVWSRTMGIVLRVDNDKPYGHATLPAKVLSKVREDYYFRPSMRSDTSSTWKAFSPI